MQVSSAFVVIMGMGVTFVGLTCIIFLTILMGKILSKPEAPKPAVAAIAQQPGFNMANVTNVSIRKI